MTPTEMELRVAEALFSVEYGNIPNYQWEQEASSPELLAYWVKCARAAIRAMREPTQQMLAIAEQQVPQRSRLGLCWQAMINAASPTTDGDK